MDHENEAQSYLDDDSAAAAVREALMALKRAIGEARVVGLDVVLRSRAEGGIDPAELHVRVLREV